MHRVVSHGESIHGRPQAPTRPLPDVRMHLARDDQRHEVAHLGRDDGGPAQVRLVADVGEDKDGDEREEGSDRGERVGCDGVPAEGAVSVTYR